MFGRQLSDFGINPIIGYLLLPILFLGLSLYLFVKTEFAEYIYAFLSASLLISLSEANRNDFLKTCFSNKHYRKIRLLENTILALPFFAFLVYKGCFHTAAALLILEIILAFIVFGNKINYTVPTPFYKQPFEFIVGFRKTFWVVLLAYFTTYMAIVVDNFNLGLFSMMVVVFVCMYFYAYLEKAYFVWIFQTSPRRFLFDKIKTALLYSTALGLPIVAGLCLFYPDKINIIIGLQCLGYMYLSTAVLAKYSAFPSEINLPQAFFMAFGIVFPPLLLAIAPFFYFQSIKRLNEILK
jgi:hypothetical protein